MAWPCSSCGELDPDTRATLVKGGFRAAMEHRSQMWDQLAEGEALMLDIINTWPNEKTEWVQDWMLRTRKLIEKGEAAWSRAGSAVGS